jgi:hypothetical protein
MRIMSNFMNLQAKREAKIFFAAKIAYLLRAVNCCKMAF